MDAILMRGQPFQTVVYRGLTPVVSTAHAVLTVNGVAAPPGTAVTGTRFVLGLSSGATWTVSFLAWEDASMTLTAPCAWRAHARNKCSRLLRGRQHV